MIIAAAQLKSNDGDIQTNLKDHYHYINLAAEKGVDLIVFPEMSLTGYTRENAKELAFSVNDSRLNELKRLAEKNSMHILVGAPVVIDTELYIGTLIFKPDNSVSVYTKQYLHQGEEVYFSSSFNYNPIMEIEGFKIGLAICADIENPKHPIEASKKGIDLYIASIFYTSQGMSGAHIKLASYATTYKMNILMSNYSGTIWNIESGGKSGFWDMNGNLESSLHEKSSGLLVIQSKESAWVSTSV